MLVGISIAHDNNLDTGHWQNVEEVYEYLHSSVQPSASERLKGSMHVLYVIFLENTRTIIFNNIRETISIFVQLMPSSVKEQSKKLIFCLEATGADVVGVRSTNGAEAGKISQGVYCNYRLAIAILNYLLITRK